MVQSNMKIGMRIYCTIPKWWWEFHSSRLPKVPILTTLNKDIFSARCLTPYYYDAHKVPFSCAVMVVRKRNLSCFNEAVLVENISRLRWVTHYGGQRFDLGVDPSIGVRDLAPENFYTTPKNLTDRICILSVLRCLRHRTTAIMMTHNESND